MNYRLEAQASKIQTADLEVTHAEGEDKKETPDADLLAYAKTAASKLAEKIGTDDTAITIQGHQTTKGRGFRPGHIELVISLLDPKR